MKKTKAFCLLLCVALVMSCLCLPVQAQEDQSVVNGCHSVDAVKPLAKSEKMVETSKAVILYELNSSTMIYNWNCDDKVYPSSMVKLMTALVALEAGNLSDNVSVTKRALSNVAGATLIAGEQLTLEALLYFMMVASANDAAVVIAGHIGGSQEGFVKLMNEKAAALGCTGTHFSNPHGLHDEQTYTTVRDLCRLLEVALKNETFRAMFTTAKYTIPATNKSEPREVVTSNHMMSKEKDKKHFDTRVTGGRTGYTSEAGRCLTVTAEENGMQLLAIVMGAKQTLEPNGLAVATYGSFEEMKVLLDYAFSNYEYRQVFLENQTVSQYPVANGINDVVTVPKSAFSTVLPIDLPTEELSWVYGNMSGNLIAPVEKGQVITNLQLWYKDLCLAQTDLVAANAVPVYTPPTASSGQKPPAESEGSWTTLLIVLGVIVGIGAVLAAAWVILPKVLAARRRERRRRNR